MVNKVGTKIFILYSQLATRSLLPERHSINHRQRSVSLKVKFPPVGTARVLHSREPHLLQSQIRCILIMQKTKKHFEPQPFCQEKTDSSDDLDAWLAAAVFIPGYLAWRMLCQCPLESVAVLPCHGTVCRFRVKYWLTQKRGVGCRLGTCCVKMVSAGACYTGGLSLKASGSW